MNVRVDHPDQLDDLVGFLRERGCIALRHDERSLEALVPDAPTPLTERVAIELHLQSWRARRAEAKARLIARSPLLAA